MNKENSIYMKMGKVFPKIWVQSPSPEPEPITIKSNFFILDDIFINYNRCYYKVSQ